jgi:uncharacterized membrane protein YhaH (DUF805 family)
MNQPSQTINPYATPKSKEINNDSNDIPQDVKIFSVRGRIGRVRYIVNLMGLYLFVGVIAAGLQAIGIKSDFLSLVLGALYLVMLVMLTVQRCHDFNTSSWLSILIIIPVVNFIFWFIPGTDGANRWGNKTPPNSVLSTILATVLPLIFIVGITAAIAIPQYQKYVERAKAVQAR